MEAAKWMDRCYVAVAAADLGFTFFGVGMIAPNGVHITEANPVWTQVMESGGKGAWALLYLLQVLVIILLARRGGRVGRLVQMSVLGATTFSVAAWLLIVPMLF